MEITRKARGSQQGVTGETAMRGNRGETKQFGGAGSSRVPAGGTQCHVTSCSRERYDGQKWPKSVFLGFLCKDLKFAKTSEK